MDYKKGYKIKPYQVQVDGVVRFTDGTNHDLIASEVACNAYGYYYDSDMGVCRAFNPNNQVLKIGKSKGDKFGSKESLIVGSGNILSQNQNTFVTGSNHTVPNRLVDSAVIGGSFGKPRHKGEVVFGGGKGGDLTEGIIKPLLLALLETQEQLILI